MIVPTRVTASRRATSGRPHRSVLRLTAILGLLLALPPATAVLALEAPPATASPTCPCSLFGPDRDPHRHRLERRARRRGGRPVPLGDQRFHQRGALLQGARPTPASTSAASGPATARCWPRPPSRTSRPAAGSRSSFSQPVAVTANTLYVAGYHTNTGHYSLDENFFGPGGVTNDPLSAPGSDSASSERRLHLQPHARLPQPDLQRQQLLGRRGVHADGADPPPAATSLWGPNATPTTIDSNDPRPVEVGVQFSSATSGFIDGVRFYKAAANTGDHIGSLWTSDGTLLAQATFSNESASGWQQVTFSQPVAITANTVYVAGYHSDTGHYSLDEGYFTAGGYTNAPLSAPGKGLTHAQRGLHLQRHTGLPQPDVQRQQLLGGRGLQPEADPRLRRRDHDPDHAAPRRQRAGPGHRDVQRRIHRRRDLTATWSSSNPAAASVSAAGVITGVGNGTTTVSAAKDGLTGTVGIKVVSPVALVLVTPLIDILQVGQSQQFSATAFLTDGSRLTVTDLATWGTLLPGVTVSPTGLVTAVRPSATIVIRRPSAARRASAWWRCCRRRARRY